jgi:hypothetical protein
MEKLRKMFWSFLKGMEKMANSYQAYFDIDSHYFPCIDDSAIREHSDLWKKTFPHETFIQLLGEMARTLEGSTRRSIWIHGAYGTGKSQCAYALRKILTVPEAELKEYWDKFEPLRKKPELLEKISGLKDRKIIVAHRYAAGTIRDPRDLFLTIQEAIKEALVEHKIKYQGENSLKESAALWIEDATHKDFFDALLKKPEYAALFSQATAEGVIASLRSDTNVSQLMGNIFHLADKEGITALNLDADRLITWIKDIISQNEAKIVLVWDEFNDYFKNNRNSLGEFQKIVSLCQEAPFYFIIVTHQTASTINNADQSWAVVQQRFNFSEITLPDNIAFELIGHAFDVKPAAKETWDELVDDLNSGVAESRTAVVKEARINDQNVMKKIMPLHPMAALVLKNIASAFQANQRSMFDFIKTANAGEVQAFQWFIESNGPEDDHPLLTIDYLWNFFYENGRKDLTADIQSILDTYPRQQDLNEKQEAVLKTVLILQAIDQRLNGAVSLFKATDRNLSYAFEGIYDLEGSACVNIAKDLVSRGILYNKPIGNNQTVFAVAMLSGDQGKIDQLKDKLRIDVNTARLVTEGNLSTVLPLTPALRLRFETEPGSGKITPVTHADFTRTINTMREKRNNYQFWAVIAFAKTDEEASAFRKVVQTAAVDGAYKNIVFIDALGSPLGEENFEQYIGFSAMAQYYSASEKDLARNNDVKAKRILDQDWKDEISKRQFVVYWQNNPRGEACPNVQGVLALLQSIVLRTYPNIFDFAKNLTESQLKLTSGKSSAQYGITKTGSGPIKGVEKSVLSDAWDTDKYWVSNPVLPISKIKKDVEDTIGKAFDDSGQISIREIYSILEEKYGFAPSNLSAFLTGFLLKEYASETYRSSDSTGSTEPMGAEKLGEMIANYMNSFSKNTLSHYKDTYIVKMTREEMAFYEVTEKAWKIKENSCSSADQAARAIEGKMRDLGLPIWCLEGVDDYNVYDIAEKYMELVQKEGKAAHVIAVEIGKTARQRVNLGDNLALLLTQENCKKGIINFLEEYKEGYILALAKEINANNLISGDIRKLFEDVKHSWLWDKDSGLEQIQLLATQYSVIKESNNLLVQSASSLEESYRNWRERLDFSHISWETAKAKYNDTGGLFEILLKIFKRTEILSDILVKFENELSGGKDKISSFLNKEFEAFKEVYKPYLGGLNDGEIKDIKSHLGTGMFGQTTSECNIKVKEAADEYRRNQIRNQMFNFWLEKTDSKNPKDWSFKNEAPILCLFEADKYNEAKTVFDILNRSNPTENEVNTAFDFIKKAEFYPIMKDKKAIDKAFNEKILGEYRFILSDTKKIKEKLSFLSIDIYDWIGNPAIDQEIKNLAMAEYNAGGSDTVLLAIDKMDDKTAKKYLKTLIKENIKVGIEIIAKEQKG